MRVYEFAKEKGLSSRDILDLLTKGGFSLNSHMSVLTKDNLTYLNSALKKTLAKKSSVGAKDSSVNKVAKKEDKKSIKRSITIAKSGSVLKKKEPIKTKIIDESKRVVPKIQKISVQKPSVRKVGVQKKVAKEVISHKKNNAERMPVTQISLKHNMPLFEAASLMGKSDGELIFSLLNDGMVCNRNHVLPVDTIKALAEGFGIAVAVEKDNEFQGRLFKKNVSGQKRWPVVVIMGHVDHGKTTLLDYLRKQNTVAREKGGITQHLGAYEVDSKHGKIVFLDTPGHEAFAAIRSRGTSITDIAVLIISAEDGIKPQTVEAIKIAKKSEVPVIVAVNKIDKISPERLDVALQTIKRELSENDLLVEDWGGDIICVPISAQTGAGVDELLEMIVLQSDLMDLKAELEVPAKAFIIESKLERGFGPVATVIVSEGVLKVGDYFTCGSSSGKVKLLINSVGQKVTQACPSIPVTVVGFDKALDIGGWLNVVSAKEYKKVKGSFVSSRSAMMPTAFPIAFIDEVDKKSINIIFKTDAQGSKDAIELSIAKLRKLTEEDCARLNVISSGIGEVSESDVSFAEIAGAMILVLHSKVDRKAASLALEKGISIKKFDVIYHLVEFLEDELKKTRKIKTHWVPKAKLLVKKIFDIKGMGVIAGCSVQEGVVANGNKVVCIRNNKTIGEGIIKSLQREKKVVKEVHAGFECGFVTDAFHDWQEGDFVSVFAEEEITSE